MSDRKSFVNHPRVQMLPEGVIQLSIEVHKYHDQLFHKYIDLPMASVVEMLTILATEVNILVEGTFDEEGINALAEQIRVRLVARRSLKTADPVLILPPSFTRN